MRTAEDGVHTRFPLTPQREERREIRNLDLLQPIRESDPPLWGERWRTGTSTHCSSPSTPTSPWTAGRPTPPAGTAGYLPSLRSSPRFTLANGPPRRRGAASGPAALFFRGHERVSRSSRAIAAITVCRSASVNWSSRAQVSHSSPARRRSSKNFRPAGRAQRDQLAPPVAPGSGRRGTPARAPPKPRRWTPSTGGGPARRQIADRRVAFLAPTTMAWAPCCSPSSPSPRNSTATTSARRPSRARRQPPPRETTADARKSSTTDKPQALGQLGAPEPASFPEQDGEQLPVVDAEPVDGELLQRRYVREGRTRSQSGRNFQYRVITPVLVRCAKA
jgi:hypothetical protein